MSRQRNMIRKTSRSMGMRLALLLLPLLTMIMQTAHAADTLAQQLASNDHVLLMRHASAPGTGDPQGFSLTDCATQRNLDASGQQQAVRIGNWLREQGVRSAIVYSSPWCRCLDTATLLDLGKVTSESALASFFNQPGNGNASNKQLQQFIATSLARKRDQALILVTHEVNITAYIGQFVNSGTMVLAKVDAHGKVLSYRIYSSP